MSAESLFYVGVSICIAVAVCAVIAASVAFFAWKRLNCRLDEEYGKRRH